MTKIFISHSVKDNDFARQIAQALIEVGINVWIDVADIPAGMKWSTAIQNGLKDCDAMIVILSPDAMASNNVEDEWQYYLDKRKKLFPVRWKPADVHFQLSRIQYVDFHEQGFAAAFARLCAELKRHGFAVDDSRGQMNVIRTDNASSKFVLPSLKGVLPDPFEWCEVPSGKVTLEIGGYLKKPMTFDIPAFAIAKYPITNAQFEVFVLANDGYVDLRWWDFSDNPQDSWAKNSQPEETNCSDNNLPRTNVSWYEAVAFCRWLTAKVGMQSGVLITLPTVQQRQRAAQGDDGRVYPWGNMFDTDKANTIESGVGQTTAITEFPHGASPYGVMDMAGNIWEWALTASLDINEKPVGRMKHGGSWNFTHTLAHVTYHSEEFPENRHDDLGFRLVTFPAL